ncbi:hypothetical protein [Anabaena sp. UHCC 0204]|uniref:hypothetical protein n=1 Tax=Anabaena sp. UHCC 0204 TaxID=2590009 RepID=UPI001446F436|nr:hypothetical protein [Anabaena sp. UHCC 0204]MTJ06681.1 hypothetical protein [Anabaena sp. UHCC 0204]
MSDIAILKEMIKETATVSLENDLYGRNKVILKEPKPPNYYVTIYGMPNDDDVIIINADEFKSPDTIFKGNSGECKRADFIIIANTVKKKVILCIEMKASKGGSMRDIIAQLKGAECFVAYCRQIGQSFWNHQNFLKDYEWRFISTKNITQKTKTRFDPNQNLVSELKILTKKGSSFQFNDLVYCQK